MIVIVFVVAYLLRVYVLEVSPQCGDVNIW